MIDLICNDTTNLLLIEQQSMYTVATVVPIVKQW